MKVTGFSFYLGIVATIMIGITFFSVIIYDVVRHRVHDTVKYLFFVFMGMLLIIYSILFTATGGTNFLLTLRDVGIFYEQEIVFVFIIFTCWILFVIMRYYGYVLFPEYSNLSKDVKYKMANKTIYYALYTVIAAIFMLWWCRAIFLYILNII